jgi:hypothetical protein
MMKEIYIYLLIIGIVFLIVKTFQSKESLILKLMASFILLIALYFCLIHIIASGWEKGRRPKLEDEGFGDPIKSIYFINSKNESVSIILDFEYSKKEISKSAKINPDYNRVDTIILRGLENIGCQTPIIFEDTIVKFPEKFNIKITDSLGKIIKTYNKEEFFSSIEKSKYTNRNDMECKETSWTLKIK